MTPSIAKLGHVSLITPDLGRSVWFFRDVLGLEEVDRDGDSIDLRAWGEFEQRSLTLREGAEAAVEHIAWRAGSAADVGDYGERLSHVGVEVQRVEPGEEPGQGEAIRFTLPHGGQPMEIYYDVEKPVLDDDRRSRLKNNSARMWDHGISPRRIDHVNVWTDNPEPAASWLAEHLGFREREVVRMSAGPMVGTWMAVTSLVHDIAVFADPGGQQGRFHHLSYYLDNFQDILRAMDILGEHGVEIDLGPGRHGISQAFFCYVRDPGSGHRVELFSGGYHIFDPDWEAIEWSEADLKEGLIFWGPEYMPGTGHAMDETTACAIPQEVGS